MTRGKRARAPFPQDALEGLGMEQTIGLREAQARLGVSYNFLRASIRRGELKAFIPGGRKGVRSGQVGYRIRVADLREWFFGNVTPTQPTEPTEQEQT